MEGGDCRAAAFLSSPNQNLKNIDFAHTKISYALRDLPFSQNQPLKLAGD
jgi:hypothetical protein